MPEQIGTTENRFFGPFLWIITGTGSLVLLYSAFRLNLAHLDSRFTLLLLITLLLSSRVIVPIPRLSSQISVSDTFVFLILLLYGGEAAIAVAAVEALVSSLRFSRKTSTVVFNSGSAALSVLITSSILTAFFGNIVSIPARPISAAFVGAICTMALVHYVSNSGIVAIGSALNSNEPIWQTWRTHYLWSSVTYFTGATAAAVIA